jgi:hypothetical protein
VLHHSSLLTTHFQGSKPTPFSEFFHPVKTAALSIDAIVLSDDSCDAYYRQAVRVSMGHVINVPTLRVSDWKKGIDSGYVVSQQSESGGLVEFVSWLRVQMKVQCLAAVVDDDVCDYLWCKGLSTRRGRSGSIQWTCRE